MRRRTTVAIAVALAFAAILPPPPAHAENPAAAPAKDPPPALTQEKADAVTALLDHDPLAARVFALCPADAFRQEEPVWRRLWSDAPVPQKDCLGAPNLCLDACLRQHSGNHCFALALALQRNGDLVKPRYAQMLYALACAMGDAGGCTNRGAHIRNADDDGGPFQSDGDAQRESCEARSFAVACDRNDAWGCAMLGQSAQNGEGVPKDPVQARALYAKSCAINPTFAACSFAQRRLKDLGP